LHHLVAGWINVGNTFRLSIAVNVAPHRDLAAKVGYVKPGSPAAQAGVEYGDGITH